MINKHPLSVVIPRWLAASGLLLMVWLAAASLPGCASAPGASSGTGGDVTTSFDETDLRKRARIRLELATAYYRQDQDRVALDEVKQVLAIDPSFSDAFNLRGLIYMRMNENSYAEDSFRRAAQLNPRDGGALHNLGWMYCQNGRYSEATHMFEQAVAIPSYVDKQRTYTIEGICQARAGHKDEAIETLRKAYDLDPGNPVTAYNLAALLHQRGDTQRAQFYIRRLNNSELANAESLWLGIRVEKRMGNRQAMEQLADSLRRRFPASRELVSYERGAFDE